MKKFKPGSPGAELKKALAEAFGVGEEDEQAGAGMLIVEKSAEKRVTMGVMYAPGITDAHGEYADAEDLEDAVHDYMENGDLAIRKQHGNQVIGHVVGMISWPYETEVELKPPGGVEKSRSVKLPAGTVYTAVRWTRDAWPDVKKGKIRGLSMGGAAVRVSE